MEDAGRTELDDLGRPDGLPRDRLLFDPEARLFARDRSLLHRLERLAAPLRLAPDQLHHPAVPQEAVVRHGKLRIAQFLPDGREVTRAILQAGATLRTADADRHAPAGRAPDGATAPAAPGPSTPDGSAAAGPSSPGDAPGPSALRRAVEVPLGDAVLMALGEVELWLLPPGTLPPLTQY